MLKVVHDKEHDWVVALERGSRRRSVAKDQVRGITALGPIAMILHKGELCWMVCVHGVPRNSRAERYARYREVCSWFGIRY